MAHSKNYVWWVDGKRLGIATTSDQENYTSPSTNDSCRVHCIKKATHFKTGGTIDLTENSDIPAQFREALIAKVHELVYEHNPETIQLAQYWRAKYDDYVRDAKRYANTGRVAKTIYSVRGYDH
tara:strand:+ start:329 stop:700 length:372 start_codon:yes stop_codon:yes gene_type:complete